MLDFLSEIINKSGNGQDGASGAGKEYVDSEIAKLREEVIQFFKALKDELDKRVLFDDLWKSEALLL